MPLQRILSPFVDVRKDEAFTALLMFVYSFLAMTAYNIIQPLTRSKVIQSLGAVNVPWVILGSGLIIGVLMVGYTQAGRGAAAPLGAADHAGADGGGHDRLLVPVPDRRRLGLGRLLRLGRAARHPPHQPVLDARQRHLRSAAGEAAVRVRRRRRDARRNDRVGPDRADHRVGRHQRAAALERGRAAPVHGASSRWSSAASRPPPSRRRRRRGRARRHDGAGRSRCCAARGRFRSSRWSSASAAFGAALLDQQVNMAAEVFKGAGQEDSIGAFLAQIRFYTSAAAFVIQVWITPRIHRYLGIGFALLMLPTNLSITAAIILLNNALWAPALARVTDQSFRYTVDKTTREVLFLPLPSELRQEVKPLVDVTVDRMARAAGALLTLVLIQPWGFALAWNQLSVVSLILAAVWFFMAVRAKREYLTSFRRSIEQRIVQPEQVRLNAADLSTIETLVQELAQPDAERVVYAIDVLESLDKRNLITPLLLYHESPKVRARALRSLADVAQRDRRSAGRRTSGGCSPIRTPPSAPGRSPRSARSATRMRRRSRGRCSPTRTRGSAPPRPRRSRPAAGAEDLDIAEAALAGLIADTSEGARPGAPRRRHRHPADLAPALPPAAHSAALRSRAGCRRRGDGQRARRGLGRLRLRADADRAAAASPAERTREDGARRLRRAGGRRARALHARSRGRRLGQAPHSGDPGADPRAEDRRRADGGARRSRRVPSLQGGVGAGTAAAERHRPDVPAPARREAGGRRGARVTSTTCRCTTTCSARTACRRDRRWRWRSSRSSPASRIGSTGC